MSFDVATLRSYVRDVPDFPKTGIVFKDIAPLLASPDAFGAVLDAMAAHFSGPRGFDAIVGIESRGFIFGAALAARTRSSFIPVRKPGKLPGAKDRVEYALEYGTDALEMQRDVLTPGQRVLVVDDVIATGGTVGAAIKLIRRQGGVVVGAAFAIELSFLEGRKRLPADTECFSLITY
ncbi:MAG: adenine phosphoribosyltransferase [Deltaproteobacteria bacterium]|nr:adenine phosphoribosyltransferase [Deltaproteobacteria bacterium]